MTASVSFQCRELQLRGFSVARIASLLGLSEDEARAALKGAVGAAPVDASPETRPVESTPRTTASEAEVWPPPEDKGSEWDVVRISQGYGRRPLETRVRWVLLWGKRVRVNGTGEVWCHGCQKFKTTQELGHPFNGCPVGLPPRNVLVSYGPDDEMPEPAADRVTRGDMDFMRVRW